MHVQRFVWYVVMVTLTTCSVASAQTTIWVDRVTGNDVSGLGTSISPFATINRAVAEAAASTPPVTINVGSGSYDWAWESSFTPSPFPIFLPDRTSIQASSASSTNDWPRIGGGITSSSVEALLCVEATTSNRSPLDLKNLWFVGEDTAGVDGASAVLVRVRGGYVGEVDIDSCYIERAEMNAGIDLRPSIMLDVGWGMGDITVSQSTIRASEGGGIVLEVGSGTTAERIAEPELHFLGNHITVSADDVASHGIRYQAAGERWLSTRMLEIRGNRIEHLGSGTGGFTTGIKVAIEPDGAAFQSVNKDDFLIVANTVRDCADDGIWLQCDRAGADAGEHMAIFAFDRNTVTGCGEAGIRLDRGDDLGGYLNAELYGNLLADNQYGIVVEGVDINAPWAMGGCTIAGNSSFGVAIDDSIGHLPASIINCIVYDNNGGGAQGGSTSTGTGVTWDPDDVEPFEFNNWQLHFGSTSCVPDAFGNVDSPPGFVDPANGDYHLTSTACSRNKGDNVPGADPMPGEVDIDREQRINPGDGSIDQGADEYHSG